MRLLSLCLGSCFGASGPIASSVDVGHIPDVKGDSYEEAANEGGEDLLVHEGLDVQEASPTCTHEQQSMTVVVDSSPAGIPPQRVSLCSMKPTEVLGMPFTGCVRPELLSMLASGNSFSKLSFHSPSAALSIGDSTLSLGSGTIALMSDARVSLNGVHGEHRHGSDCGALTVKMSTFEQLQASVTDPIWVGQGAQGAVLKAQWRSGCTVAVKWLVTDAVNVPAAYMEALLGKMLAHPYLVQTFDYAICRLEDGFGTATARQQQQQRGQPRSCRASAVSQPQPPAEGQSQVQGQVEESRASRATAADAAVAVGAAAEHDQVGKDRSGSELSQSHILATAHDDTRQATGAPSTSFGASVALVGTSSTAAAAGGAGASSAVAVAAAAGLAGTAGAAAGDQPRLDDLGPGGLASGAPPAPMSLDLLADGEPERRRLCDSAIYPTACPSGIVGRGVAVSAGGDVVQVGRPSFANQAVSGGGVLPFCGPSRLVAGFGLGVELGAGPEAPGTPLSHDVPSTSAFEGGCVVVSDDSFDGNAAAVGGQSVDCMDILKQLGAAPGKYVVQIVSEWCDEGTLHAAIRKGVFRAQGRRTRTWALRALLRTAREVALGMCHLHSLNIIHGDLKPGNVLLKSSRVDSRGFVAKVADFGLSRLCRQHEQYVETADWGTVPYMAGEYLDNKLCKSSDVYSFGVLLWQMYTAKTPFAGHHEAQVAVGVMMGDLQLEWPAQMPPPLLRLGQSCCRHEPDQRPTFKEVVVALAGIETQVRDAYNRAKLVRRCDSGAVASGVPSALRGPGGGPSLLSFHPGYPSGFLPQEGALLGPSYSGRSGRLPTGGVASSSQVFAAGSKLLDPALGPTLLARPQSQSLLLGGLQLGGSRCCGSNELGPELGGDLPAAAAAAGIPMAPSPFSSAAAGQLAAVTVGAGVYPAPPGLSGRVSRLHIRTSLADDCPVPGGGSHAFPGASSAAAGPPLHVQQQQQPPSPAGPGDGPVGYSDGGGLSADASPLGSASVSAATAAGSATYATPMAAAVAAPFAQPLLLRQQPAILPTPQLPGRGRPSQAEAVSAWQYVQQQQQQGVRSQANTTQVALNLSQSLNPTAEIEPFMSTNDMPHVIPAAVGGTGGAGGGSGGGCFADAALDPRWPPPSVPPTMAGAAASVPSSALYAGSPTAPAKDEPWPPRLRQMHSASAAALQPPPPPRLLIPSGADLQPLQSSTAASGFPLSGSSGTSSLACPPGSGSPRFGVSPYGAGPAPSAALSQPPLRSRSVQVLPSAVRPPSPPPLPVTPPCGMPWQAVMAAPPPGAGEPPGLPQSFLQQLQGYQGSLCVPFAAALPSGPPAVGLPAGPQVLNLSTQTSGMATDGTAGTSGGADAAVAGRVPPPYWYPYLSTGFVCGAPDAATGAGPYCSGAGIPVTAWQQTHGSEGNSAVGGVLALMPRVQEVMNSDSSALAGLGAAPPASVGAAGGVGPWVAAAPGAAAGCEAYLGLRASQSGAPPPLPPTQHHPYPAPCVLPPQEPAAEDDGTAVACGAAAAAPPPPSPPGTADVFVGFTSPYYTGPSLAPASASSSAFMAGAQGVAGMSTFGTWSASSPGMLHTVSLVPAAAALPPGASLTPRKPRSSRGFGPASVAAFSVAGGTGAASTAAGVGVGPGGVGLMPGGARRAGACGPTLVSQNSPRGFGSHARPLEDGREGFCGTMVAPLAPLQEAVEGPNSAGVDSGATSGTLT